MSNEFNLSIASDLEKDINKAARETTLKVLRGLVLATPVDTGRAKGNWQVSIDAPIKYITEDIDRSGNSAINKALTFLLGQKTKKYPVFWVVNNLPYISALNSGHSQQAPALFVETVIKRVTNGS